MALFQMSWAQITSSSWKKSSQYYFSTVWSSSYFSRGLSVCKWLLQITGRKWSHIICCNSEYLLDSSSKYKGHCGSQQELHPKFFKPFGYCCSLLWSSNSSSMSSPSITCHVSWSNNHIVWLWTLCMKNNTFVAVSSISRFQWPLDDNFLQKKKPEHSLLF